jgi:hypothetical protein
MRTLAYVYFEVSLIIGAKPGKKKYVLFVVVRLSRGRTPLTGV